MLMKLGVEWNEVIYEKIYVSTKSWMNLLKLSILILKS